MLTSIYCVSISVGFIPRKHRPLQQRHQSQAIIPASSRPVIKREGSEAAAADLSVGPSGNQGVALITSMSFFFPRGLLLFLFCS